MRSPRRPSIVNLAGITVTVAALLFIAAVPVFAKEGMQAALDAPIGRDTPPGTVLSVGMTVTVLDGSVLRAVEGSPIYLRLYAPDGTSTWELGRQDAGVRGHYTMRIAVPEGGVARVEVGIHGSYDLPIMIAGEPLAAGGITAATAQVAAALAPAITPFPRPTTVPGAAAAPVEAPSTDSMPAPATGGLLAAAAALALGALAVIGIAARRSRTGAGPAAPRQVPGA